MSDRKLNEIRDEAESIYQAYQSLFAGQPRATRDPSQLNEMITRLKELIEEGQAANTQRRDPALSSVLDTARENLERYTDEYAAIKKAQANPSTIDAARLAARANRVFDVYNRHFAGQPRETRDFRLLEELIDELAGISGRMEPLAERGIESAIGDLETVTQQMELYQEEVDRIRNARTVGSEDEQASRLAHLANAQFNLYNGHFAGKARTTRRPELIERMIANLEDYRGGMQALAQAGYQSDSNRKNIGIVENNLEMYRSELEAIRETRSQTSARDLAGALGGAANEVMEEYREHYAGMDRRGRDLDKLSIMCDELRYLQMQMLSIASAMDLDFNQRNIQVVDEARSMYESEWRQIREASGIA